MQCHRGALGVTTQPANHTSPFCARAANSREGFPYITGTTLSLRWQVGQGGAGASAAASSSVLFCSASVLLSLAAAGGGVGGFGAFEHCK